MAVEPLVTDPVSVCYDAEGRLYVVEMRGYPYPEKTPTGHVVRLEDRDGDGRFDARTVFVDGLSWPTGIVPYDGGVFIAVAPDILYAKDTSGDGVADVKKVMFTGFGTENVQGLVNGLLLGPGRLDLRGRKQQRRRDQEPVAARCKARFGSRPRLSLPDPTARPSRRSPEGASSAIRSMTGGTGSPAATATTSARSCFPRMIWSETPP